MEISTIESLVSLMASVCAGFVAMLAILRIQRLTGTRRAIYVAMATFSGFVALLNLSALFAVEGMLIRGTLAYMGFATVILLAAVRSLASLTHDPTKDDHTDAAV